MSCEGFRSSDPRQREADRSAAQEALRGKVVLIGSENDLDRAAVLDESMYGYELQARYVAALLGHAYLREWPLLLRLVLGISITVVMVRVKDAWGASGRVRWLHLPQEFFRDGNPPSKAGLRTYWVIVIAASVPFALSAMFFPLGWMPPLPLLALTETLWILETSLFLQDWKKLEEHPGS